MLGTGCGTLAGTTGDAAFDELLVLVPELLSVVSIVDGTLVGFIGYDVFTVAAAGWSIECNSAGAGGLRLRVGLWLGGTGVRRGEFLLGDTGTALVCIACKRISFTKSDDSLLDGMLSLPFFPASLLICLASLICNPPGIIGANSPGAPMFDAEFGAPALWPPPSGLLILLLPSTLPLPLLLLLIIL